MLTSYRSLAFIGRVASQFKLRSSPVSSCPPAQRSRHALTSYRSLAFKLCSRTSFQASLHSGLRIRYGLRALRQAPRLPLSHFAHQSARLRSLSAVALNSLGLRVPPVLATLATAVINSCVFEPLNAALKLTLAYAFRLCSLRLLRRSSTVAFSNRSTRLSNSLWLTHKKMGQKPQTVWN